MVLLYLILRHILSLTSQVVQTICYNGEISLVMTAMAFCLTLPSLAFSPSNDTHPGTSLALEDVSLQSLHFPQKLSPVNILGNASLLLKHFQKNIIPQMTVVPLAKSPWNILNVPAALVTLGELAIMESENVSHARQANLYSLLACSAVHLAMDLSTETIGSCPRNHWKDVSEQVYQDAI
ncbi:hypothetical protein N7449_007612 [Penicillium cf. viridicatum]|uniref:Uncharacterized protein n=1 Tax=Penicillium cf. viridicatum TaxID=2972119 RepID=A0A9W9JHT0_9EURO|nr:hypothetical protein N7449_007612 [Penicillium cf. viridicatum]